MPSHTIPARAPATEAALAGELAALVALDPALAEIAALAGPLPLRRLEPGFAGLVWVVTGQQISTFAARAIHDRTLAALGSLTPAAVAAADDAVLRSAGQSGAKTRTLRAAAEAALTGALDLDALGALEVEEAIAALTRVKGVGRWTAEVYLLFALGHRDAFPAGDLALREAARLAFALEARPTETELRARAERWRPRRGIAARLLWAYYRRAKAGRNGTPV